MHFLLLLEYARFPMLCESLLYNEVDLLYAHLYPLSCEPPAHHLTHLGHPRALSCVLCAI